MTTDDLVARPGEVTMTDPTIAALIEAWKTGRLDDDIVAAELVHNAMPAIVAIASENERLRAELAEENGWFKNFHCLLCERFGYTHDEVDWQRDQLSLIEFIAAQLSECKEALRDCANGMFYIRETHGELYGVGWDRALGKADAVLGTSLAQSQPKDGEKA